MMKPQAAELLYNGAVAGVLRRSGLQYSFRYEAAYLQGAQAAISLTLPKWPEAFVSPVLFSFFYGLLAEGVAKQIQCRELKIDERDHFTRLLRTAHTETIGAVTVREISPAV
ncbi:HipA N-terminal domain-containing protein [Hymenobacter sp. H14-R3]|uniref:HipA N-terminal domain-containing protein n=1 Tax=Hymenobacter sp. H14-R3 TaxID=3046308 RepID=UPI0024BAB23A|nr:HipA N-terminal domain-containing protein [Hymenobacter sp. H14-R3]MDJ0364287.1 HipA N-terminal domain-containing protein [Hymenobacter sp. H14-R3]